MACGAQAAESAGCEVVVHRKPEPVAASRATLGRSRFGACASPAGARRIQACDYGNRAVTGSCAGMIRTHIPICSRDPAGEPAVRQTPLRKNLRAHRFPGRRRQTSERINTKFRWHLRHFTMIHEVLRAAEMGVKACARAARTAKSPSLKLTGDEQKAETCCGVQRHVRERQVRRDLHAAH